MKPVLITVCLLVAISNTFGQQLVPSIIWQKCFGGTKDDRANDILQTPDLGFLVVGSSKSADGQVTGHHGSTNNTDAWVVKISHEGELEWQRSYGGTDLDEFNSIIATNDGNYLCFGVTNSNDGDVSGQHGLQDLWVVKIDRQGNILWQKCLGGSGYEREGNARKNADGTMLIIGTTSSTDGDVSGNHGQDDIWVVKLNAAGNINWSRCFGGTYVERGMDILESGNGSFIIAAEINSDDGDFGSLIKINPPNGFVVKSDSTGFLYWARGRQRSVPVSINHLSGNEYSATYDDVGCYPMSTNFATTVTKITSPVTGGDATQNSIASFGVCETITSGLGYRSQGTNSFATLNGIDHLSVGAYDTIETQSSPHGLSDGFIASYKTNRTPNYRTFIGGSGEDGLLGVIPVSETEFLVCGYTSSNDDQVSGNHGGYDFWVVKLGRTNLIKGTVYKDLNRNGVKDSNEPFANNILVQSQKGTSSIASTTYHGVFINGADTGQYTTVVLTQLPNHTIVPSSQISSFTGYNEKDSVSFAIQSIPGLKDYSANLYYISEATPGFNVTYQLVCANRGTDTLTDKMIRVIKDSRLTNPIATPEYTSISGDTISWPTNTILPGDSIYFTISFTAAVPPTLNNGDTLSLEAHIDSTADISPADNYSYVRQIVTGSYDPNDKHEVHAGFISPQEISAGKPLNYTIRFQNTGTDTAINVVIRDTLDSKLDWSSLEIIKMSHPASTTIKDGNKVTWTFNDILLPDSNINEPASHGYIIYRIKPIDTLHVGDTVRNSASIYFDFNLPVRTNAVETVVKPLAPATPVITGLQTNYCSTSGVQTIKITNMPAVGSDVTVTAKVDANAVVIGADSTFNFNVSTLGAGTHHVSVLFSNATANRTHSSDFTITQAVTPEVDLLASATTITNLAIPVIVTALNTSGGGNAPLYTFARDRNFTQIAQSESVQNTWTFSPSILTIGDNWIYVRMKSSANCVVFNTITDSIKMVRSSVTGIIDPDMPGRTINIYPNPFNDVIRVDGLSPAKTYTITLYNLHGQQLFRRKLDNRTSVTFDRQYPAAGTYWLSIYDEKQKRLLGTVKLVKQ